MQFFTSFQALQNAAAQGASDFPTPTPATCNFVYNADGVWTDGYEGEDWAKERGFGKLEFTSPNGYGAWIQSEGDKHVVQWLRGRGDDKYGESHELKPGRKTIHGDVEKAKAFAEKMIDEEQLRQKNL